MQCPPAAALAADVGADVSSAAFMLCRIIRSVASQVDSYSVALAYLYWCKITTAVPKQHMPQLTGPYPGADYWLRTQLPVSSTAAATHHPASYTVLPATPAKELRQQMLTAGERSGRKGEGLTPVEAVSYHGVAGA